jgi:hypothetical protein
MGSAAARLEPTEPDARDARRLPGRSLSKWEIIGFGLLALAIVSLCARPAYLLSAKRRAAKLRTEVFRLKGSQDVRDWRRLLELGNAPIRREFPKPFSWLFEAGQDKVGAYEVSVRGPVEGVLRESVLRDTSSTIKALTCNDPMIPGWATSQLLAGFSFYPAQQGHLYPEACRRLIEACLSGDPEVRKFVLSGNGRRQGKILQLAILLEISRIDGERGYPLIKEFLADSIDRHLSNSIPIDQVLLLGQAFLAHLKTEDLPLAERFVRELIRMRLSVDSGGILAQYFTRAGPQGAGVFEEGLTSSSVGSRGLVICEAANQRLLSPHRLWVKALEELDPRCRVIAARVLGYERAAEAAEVLVKRLDDAEAEVRLQAAWSLATMGDVRGREALKRFASDPVAQCFDLLEMFASRSGGKSFPPPPPPLPNQAVSKVAAAILAHVDAGGTIPLTISAWPGSGQPLRGEPAHLY